MGDAGVKYGAVGRLAEAARAVVVRVRRRAAAVVLVVLTVPVAYKAVTGTHGYFAYQQELRDAQKLASEVEELKRNNAKLEENIKGLKSDPKVIEREAREQLRYVHPGDVVITVPQPQTRVETASVPATKSVKP